MTTPEPSSTQGPGSAPYLGGAALAELTALLAVHEAQLRVRLKDAGHAVPDTDSHEVTDQKAQAADASQQRVDDAEADVLRLEWARLLRARQRAREHRYGLCLACGDAIALQRLRALPEAELCLSCQTAQEQPGTRR